jgi:response regulator NasT
MQLLASEVGALEEQLETRKLIDRAKGVLIDKSGLSESDAYAFIQRSAMSERARMKDIAEQILAGTLMP